MKLSSPEQMDEPAEESTGKQSDSLGNVNQSVEKLRDQTVSLFGEEMPLVEGVELLGEFLDQPEAFGLVSESQYRDLADRVEQLERENERMAESLRQAYEILDEAESVSQFSLNKSVYDPTEEFE